MSTITPEQLADRVQAIAANPATQKKHLAGLNHWIKDNCSNLLAAPETELEKLVASLRKANLWELGSVAAKAPAKAQVQPATDRASERDPASPEPIPAAQEENFDTLFGSVEQQQAPASGAGEPEPTFDQTEAARLHKAGIKLVPLHNLRKRPLGNAWNKPEHFIRKVDLTASGYGIPLVANGLCSIDPDQMEMATIALAAVGFNLDEIMAKGVRTTSTRPGSGGRAAFKATDNLTWFSFSVRLAEQKESTTVFELRAGSPNLQDCCPGVAYQTVKLVNGEEVVSAAIYRQEYAAGSPRFDAAPELPVGFDEFWEKMSTDPAFRRYTEQKMTAALVAAGHSVEPVFNLRFSGKKLAIECDKVLRRLFNAAVSVESILSRHGYLAPKRKGDRWASPGSTGAPSIRLIPGKESLWQSDHQSDPLNGTFDAAQASVVLDHGYDVEAFEEWCRERLQGLKQAEAMVTFSEELGHGPAGEYWDIPADPVVDVPDVVPEPVLMPAGHTLPPGFVGEVATYILSSSRNPVPSFAIAGALSLISYLIRNIGYVEPSDTSLNLYQVLIGDTGKGKEDPRKAIKRILDAMGDRDITAQVVETLSSGTALLRSLSGETGAPYLFMMSDEYGIFMQAAMQGKDEHRRDLVKELMSLYSLARSFHAGKKYADPKQNIPRINNPYVVVLGTTTEDELFEGLNMLAINNGSANRNIYIYANVKPPKNRRPDIAVPKALIDKLQALFGAFALNNLQPMQYGPGAEECLVEFGDNLPTTGKFVNLWSRAEENVIRVAGVLAFCDGKIIKLEHVRWAIEYVKASIEHFDVRSETQISESLFDKKLNKVLEIISNPRHYINDIKFSIFTRKGKMPRGKLLNLMKIPAKELEAVIEVLVAGKQINVGMEDGNTIYWA